MAWKGERRDIKNSTLVAELVPEFLDLKDIHSK